MKSNEEEEEGKKNSQDDIVQVLKLFPR